MWTRRLTATLAVALFVVVAGCKKEKPEDELGEPGASEAKVGDDKKGADEKGGASKGKSGGKGIDSGNPKLAKAFKAVLDSCEVSEWGYVRAKTCKDPDAEKNLRKQEKMLGLKETLTSYCAALQDENHLARALASWRISTMSYSRKMSEAADEEVFSCLLEQLPKQRKRQFARRLAKAVTYMGTALKKDEDVIKAIEAHPTKAAKQAGYAAMWANGRLRVFPTLEKVIKEGNDTDLKRAAIRSFGYGNKYNDDEAKKVCALLMPLMTNEEVKIASTAAYRVASSCKKDKESVITAAKKMIKADKFDLTYVSALRNTAGWFSNKASPKQRKDIIGVLKKVLKNKTVSPLTRASALGAIYHIDKKHGKKMAKKYKKHSERFIQREAQRILKK